MNPQLHYIDYDQPPLNEPSGAGKYYGAVATGYDAKRTDNPKWTVEQGIIEGWISELPSDSIVLDCPVGTGRFLGAYYQNGLKVCCVDRSVDMLKEAATKASALQFDPNNIQLVEGDVRALKIDDKAVGCSVMCRLTRWLEPSDCMKAIAELARVTKNRIIFTARIEGPHARPLELFTVPGWKITRNEAGYVEDYRIVMMEPA